MILQAITTIGILIIASIIVLVGFKILNVIYKVRKATSNFEKIKDRLLGSKDLEIEEQKVIDDEFIKTFKSLAKKSEKLLEIENQMEDIKTNLWKNIRNQYGLENREKLEWNPDNERLIIYKDEN